MITFDDLDFQPHPYWADAVRAYIVLGDVELSIIAGPTAYQHEGQWEVCVTTPNGNDTVIGWQTEADINALMAGIQLAQERPDTGRTEPELDQTSDHEDARSHFEHVHQTHYENDTQDLY